MAFLESRNLLPLLPEEYGFRERVIYWNNILPFDFIWRKKNKVIWLSEEHKKISFVSQVFEYVENNLMSEEYKGTGMSQKEIEQDFDKLELSEF